MNIYLTTTDGGAGDTRNIPGWPLQNYGAKLAYYASSSNNIGAADGPSWTAFGAKSLAASADATIIDREIHSDTDAQILAMVQWVRAANGGKPVFVYTNEPYFGCPSALIAAGEWPYLNPDAGEAQAFLNCAKSHGPWAMACGAVLVKAQVMRPSQFRTLNREVQRQVDLIRAVAPNSTPTLFIQDTWNWSQNTYQPQKSIPALWPALPESMCDRLFMLATMHDADVCVFQPYMIDASYPYRPMLDVLGKYLVCPADREK